MKYHVAKLFPNGRNELFDVTGDTVEGEIRAPKEGERYFALTTLYKVNFDEPDAVRMRTNFDNLTPLYPEQKLSLDTLDPTVKDKSARVIDIVSPQGKGQRALIVAPPRTGKTVLLQNIAARSSTRDTSHAPIQPYVAAAADASAHHASRAVSSAARSTKVYVRPGAAGGLAGGAAGGHAKPPQLYGQSPLAEKAA